MSNKELLILVTLVGGGIGAARAVKATQYLAPPTPHADTLAVLSSDVRQLKEDVSTLRADMRAMLRAQCVTNPTRWEIFETAGIQCADIIPSARQAGRPRR